MAITQTPPIKIGCKSCGSTYSDYWMNEETGTFWYKDKDTKKKYQGPKGDPQVKATSAEVIAGLDDEKYVTSLGLSTKVSSETQSGLIQVATQAETDAGLVDNVAVTPLKLDEKIRLGLLTQPVSEQATDASDIVAKYNALQLRFEELVTKLNTLILK